MGKRKKKKRPQIFTEPEHDVLARKITMDDFGILGNKGLTYWGEVDQTWDRMGHEPWERLTRKSDLLTKSTHMNWLFTRMKEANPATVRAMLGNETPSEFISNSVNEYMTHSVFHRSGHHVFRLWPALCHALLATELRAPRELVKLPFYSFYFHFPQAIGDLIQIDNRDGTSAPADGAFVNWAFEIPRSGHPIEKEYRELMERPGEPMQGAVAVKIMSRHMPDHPTKDANFHYYFLPLNRDDEITLDSIKRDNPWINSRNSPTFGGPGIQLVLNALLYINSVSSDVRWTNTSEFQTLTEKYAKKPAKEPQKKARRASMLSLASHARTHDTGSTLRIPTLPGDDAGATAHTSWTLAHRVQVRGHFRNQAYGPGRADRRLKWIQPHWRGPEMGDVVSRRTYEVVTPEGKAV
jgi:hypothetical protein